MNELDYKLEDSDVRVIKEYWKHLFPSLGCDSPMFKWDSMQPLHPQIDSKVPIYFFYGHFIYRVPSTGNYSYDVLFHTDKTPVETARGQIDFKESEPYPAWSEMEFDNIRSFLKHKAYRYVLLQDHNFFTNNLDQDSSDYWTFKPYTSRYECAKRGMQYDDIYDRPFDPDELLDEEDDEDGEFLDD